MRSAGATPPPPRSRAASAGSRGLLESGDTRFVYTDDGAEAGKDAITSSPLWPTLAAVREDRVHWVDAGGWNASDPVALNMILDDSETMFVGPGEQQAAG